MGKLKKGVFSPRRGDETATCYSAGRNASVPMGKAIAGMPPLPQRRPILNLYSARLWPCQAKERGSILYFLTL